MGKEERFLPRADAERVRKQIADTGEAALAKLAAELPLYGRRKNGRGKAVLMKLPERWVRNFKAIADQLRRDYRLDPVADTLPPEVLEPAAAADDPLAGLKLVNDEEAA